MHIYHFISTEDSFCFSKPVIKARNASASSRLFALSYSKMHRNHIIVKVLFLLSVLLTFPVLSILCRVLLKHISPIPVLSYCLECRGRLSNFIIVDPQPNNCCLPLDSLHRTWLLILLVISVVGKLRNWHLQNTVK